MRLKTLLLLFVVANIVGCGSSEDFVYTEFSGQTLQTGDLRVQFVLERAVPSEVTTLTITGFDARDQVLYGPVNRDKSSLINLPGVPAQVVRVQIDYFDDGVLIGRGSNDIVIRPGQLTTLNDPDFQDINASPVITGISYPDSITDQALLEANVESPGGLLLTYSWMIAGIPDIQGEQTDLSSWTWTPAGIPGVYELLLDVVNSSGLRTTAVRTLNVVGVHPWPSTGLTAQNTRRSASNARTGVQTNTPLTFANTIVETQPAVSGDGTVYLGVTDTIPFRATLKVVASGGGVQDVLLPGSHTRSCPVILPDGTVVTGSYDFDAEAYLNFVNPTTLAVTTIDLPGNAVEESCNVGVDGTIYVGSFLEMDPIEDSSDPVLNILAPNASEVESISLAGNITLSTPGVAPDGTVYICSHASDQAYLNILTPGSTTVQSVELEGEVADSTPTIASDGRVFVASYDDTQVYLNAYSPDTGSVLSIDLQGEFADASPGLLSDETVVLVSTDAIDASYVNFVGPTSATPDRVVTLGGSSALVCAPAISADNTVYVGSFGNVGVNLSVVTPGAAAPTTVALSGDDVFSSPSIGEDGTIYISSNDFGTGQAFLNIIR